MRIPAVVRGLTRRCACGAILALVALGCRSISETTYVTRDQTPEQRDALERAAAGNLVGQLVAFAVASQSGHR